MNKTTFKVALKRVEIYHVEVSAEGYSEAIEAAAKKATLTHCEPVETFFSPYEVQQTGEPWVHVSWYDLHGPGDVVVGTRAIGNRFTAAEVDLIHTRLQSLGLKIEDSWNGSGTDTVSFRCSGRVGTNQFTKEQKNILNAPRPEDLG